MRAGCERGAGRKTPRARSGGRRGHAARALWPGRAAGGLGGRAGHRWEALQPSSSRGWQPALRSWPAQLGWVGRAGASHGPGGEGVKQQGAAPAWLRPWPLEPGASEAGAAGAASARNARLAQRAAPRRRCGNRGRREAHRAPGSRAQARAAAHARESGRAGGHGHVARACRRSAGRRARQRATLAGYPPCAQCAKRSAVRASDGACGRGCGWDAWRARARQG